MNPGPNSPITDESFHVRDGEIAILLATRGRPHFLIEELNTLKDNTQQKDKVVLWVYVDDDDGITRRAIAEKQFPDPGFSVRWHIGPRPPALGQAHQALWNASGRAAAVYMISCDDARFDTPGWDAIVRREFAKYGDGVMLGFAHDPNTGNQATYPFIGWGFLKTLGYEKVFPGIFAFWFDDKWVEHIALMVGRCTKIPITINPVGGDKGKTQRMRCVPFWMRFFHLTLPEREECARMLLDARHPDDTAARAAAQIEMDKMVAFIKKEENNAFSDVYCVFQEERHSAIPPENRDAFNPLYLRQETAAIVRLLSHAHAHIAKGNHAEALLYIEATQMADIRMRAAHQMKIQCLRALGRNGEADALAREEMLAWPQLNPVRRLFRFLGMVANEGRRLIAGVMAARKQPPTKTNG